MFFRDVALVNSHVHSSHMRIVTWNCCRGRAPVKLARLATLMPTLAVVQECARPEDDSPSCLWFGDNPRQGIAVAADGEYRVEAAPMREVPRYTFPIQVLGPRPFLLLAVWSQQDPIFPYVQGVIRAVEIYRDRIASEPTVIVGDFNSNAIWNRKRPGARDHGALVDMLSDLGLVSAYHQFHGESHGSETRPTLYLRWQRAMPYHVDYCFIPKSWAPHLRSVEVGNYRAWAKVSDHRPLVVDLDFTGAVTSCHP